MGENGVISPISRALLTAASRVCTSNRRYAPESRLRVVELATDIFFDNSSVVQSG